MIISMIAAISENGIIGRKGKLPWKLPDDLKLFKRLTMGHHLIVGRKTYESIGKPLPGRTMIVLSRQEGYSANGCLTAASLPEALDIARNAGETEAFIGGGAAVYAQALTLADRFYLTRVHTNIKGDAEFPLFDESGWKVTVRHQYPARKGQRYSFTFMIMDRKKKFT
jgi:dihydrofolate reductase